MLRRERFPRFSALVLLFTVGVIVWGAYVRASKSGNGCGSHWPLCNGQVVPDTSSIHTLIEAAHRGSSGLALVLVVVQAIWAFRAFAAGSRARRAAAAALLFMLTEAGVGAGLVLFEMVAGNASTARAAWMVAHLLNTFALLAAQALTAWHARRELRPQADGVFLPLPRGLRVGLGVGLVGILATASSGAVAALGDTLFPARSLAEGLRQDFAPAAHLFLRVRISHPALAVATAALLLTVAGVIAGREGAARVRAYATTAAALVIGQVLLGFLNLGLLAPTGLQLLHLVSADAVWISFVLLTAASTTRAERAPAPERRPPDRLWGVGPAPTAGQADQPSPGTPT